MKSMLKTTICFAVLFAALPGSRAAQRPNVLFIAVDDLNACPERMQGETHVATPNINRLADRGMFFVNAHCAAPLCGPSRASVLSGLAPSTTGVYGNAQDWRENSILKHRVTLPQHFKDNGYVVMGGGKIYHASSFSELQRQGLFDPRPWDEYFPSMHQQLLEDVVPNEILPDGSERKHSGHFDWAATEMTPEETGDGQVVAWAEQVLAKKYDRPLFLGVGIYHPHYPWYTPKKYFDLHPPGKVSLPEIPADDLDDLPPAALRIANDGKQAQLMKNGEWKDYVRAYNAAVSFSDDMIGRLLDALDRGPNAGNTVVVLWADNGYHNGQKQKWEKYALWEQTTHVPLVLAAPDLLPPEHACHQPVSLLDIYPTLIELCDLPPVDALDGTSLVPLMHHPAVETGRAVLTTQKMGSHAIRSKRWRYIRYANGDEELYDQQQDPKDFNNLAANPEYDAVKADLSRFLPNKNAPVNPAGRSWKASLKKGSKKAGNPPQQ